jgi:hypothetical protein
MGKPAEAIAAKEEALPVFQKLADERPEMYGFQDSLAREHNNLDGSLENMG